MNETLNQKVSFLARYRVSFLVLGIFIVLQFVRPGVNGASVSPELLILSGSRNVTLSVSLPSLASGAVYQMNEGDFTSDYYKWGTVQKVAEIKNNTAQFVVEGSTPQTFHYELRARYPWNVFPARSKAYTLRVILTQRPAVLPSDPGESGKQTLAGIDSNSNGVRDDVEREIFFLNPESERARLADEQIYKLEQEILLTPLSQSTNLNKLKERVSDSFECAGDIYLNGGKQYTGMQSWRRTGRVSDVFLNTTERFYRDKEAAISAKYTGKGRPGGQPLYKDCTFDPTQLPD